MNSYCNLFYDSDNRYEKADYYKLVDDEFNEYPITTIDELKDLKD